MSLFRSGSIYLSEKLSRMMKTELYHHEPYTVEFSAEVTEAGEDWIVLDQTLFYPGGGGQEHDKGSINGLKVKEVVKENGRIVHKVPGHMLSKGEKIKGQISWKRRYELMKGHTGEHMLFSSLKRLNEELELVKISISEDKKYLIVKGEVDWDMAQKAQEQIIGWIAEDLEITEQIVSKNDPVLDEIRIKKERITDDEVRIVRIGDVDASACSGIHVKSTSEVEFLIISKLNSAKPEGDWEVEFMVGSAAKKEAAERSAQLMKLVSLTGAQKGNVVSTVENLRTSKEQADAALKQYMDSSLKSIQPVEINGIQAYIGSFPELDKKMCADYVNTVTKEKCVCIIGSGSERYSLTVACNPDIPINCAEILNQVLAEDGGRGSGKPSFASGGAGGNGSGKAVERATKILQMSLTKNEC